MALQPATDLVLEYIEDKLAIVSSAMGLGLHESSALVNRARKDRRGRHPRLVLFQVANPFVEQYLSENDRHLAVFVHLRGPSSAA
jgi:hypothetical protein